jgi:tetratricopeptide (TPR) repeat protein
LAIKIPPKENWTYATVMGQGGIEYGLAYYQDWVDVERMYLPHDDPMEIIPAGGTRSLLFSPVIDLPFDDVEDIEKYGWTLAGPQAYPFPAIFRTTDQVERPDRDEVLWYEAVLRAIPEFVRDHLKKNADGEIQPVNARIVVSTAAGLKNVEIKYPAGQLPLGQMTAENFFDEEEVDTDAETMPFDLRGMEGQLAHLSGQLGTSFFDRKTKKAQEIMYEAWDELNPARRLTLAHKALKQSENCADAYVLLAEEAAASVDEALDYYEKGVAAGERALGIEFFKENKGHFWAILETRPYMRALEGKADCLWQLKQKQEALQTYQEMLHLNPNDHQGIRYILIDLLLGMNREEEVEKLLKKYKEDYSAAWLYTRALMTWRKNGPSAVAERTLKRAVEENPYVLDYLTGKKRIPNMKPDSITWGGDSEAVDYAAYHLNHWRKTAGAIEWLKSQQQKTRSTKRTPPKRARNESKKQGTI